MRFPWRVYLLLLAGCSSEVTAEQKCDQLGSTLCKKLFQCGAGAAYPSEADCEMTWTSKLDCDQWVVPAGCSFDWGPFDQCLSDVANEACADAQHGPPSSCNTAVEPPMCAGGPVFCSDRNESSTGAGCTRTISGCTDKNTYAVTCTNGACTCQVNGMTTQPASGLTECSPDEAVLNPACGWNLFRTYRPEPPDLAPPPDLTPGCIINGVYYPLDTPNPQNPCQSCQMERTNDWTDLDNVPCGTNGCGQCSQGMCGVGYVAYQQANATAIALDATNVYWLALGNLSKAPLSGGNPASPTMIAINQPNPTGLAINAVNAYWTNQAAPMGYLQTAPLSATIDPGSTLVGQLTTPGAIVIDSTYAYWVSQGTAGNTDGAILKDTLAAGGQASPTTLASSLASPLGIAIFGGNIYWTNSGDGTVMKIAAGGAASPTTIATGQVAPSGIAVDASAVYWVNQGTSSTNYTDGTVMKLPNGAVNPTPLATGQRQPTAIAIDATNAYWTNTRDGTVWKVPLAGGMQTQLASYNQSGSVQGIAVNSQCVYWTGTNGVLKTSK